MAHRTGARSGEPTMKKKPYASAHARRMLLREEGALEEVEARAEKRVLARQLEQLMKQQQVTKASLAQRMGTSRSALDRLLDPTNASATLYTITSVARALGTRLDCASPAHAARLRRASTGRSTPGRRRRP